MKILKFAGHSVRAYIDKNGVPCMDENDIQAWIDAGWKPLTRAEELEVRDFCASASHLRREQAGSLSPSEQEFNQKRMPLDEGPTSHQ